MNASKKHKIIISPIGDLPAELLDAIRIGIERFFGFVTIVEFLIEDIGFALDPNRDQYHSTSILEKLDSIAPSNCIKVLAITEVDLFIPILTFVYGEAQLDGTACVISIHRLNEGISTVSNRENYFSRIVKEAIHELGHTFKLRHCKDKTCIMHYCRNIKDVDQKSDHFCRYCKVLLEDEKKKILG